MICVIRVQKLPQPYRQIKICDICAICEIKKLRVSSVFNRIHDRFHNCIRAICVIRVPLPLSRTGCFLCFLCYLCDITQLVPKSKILRLLMSRRDGGKSRNLNHWQANDYPWDSCHPCSIEFMIGFTAVFVQFV